MYQLVLTPLLMLLRRTFVICELINFNLFLYCSQCFLDGDKFTIATVVQFLLQSIVILL